MTAFAIYVGSLNRGFWIHHNYFVNKTGVTYEFTACEVLDFGFVHDNYYDQTTGGTNGSAMTFGTTSNLDVHDNIIKRLSGSTGFGISLEAWGDYNNCYVHHNQITNGTIVLGVGGTWDSDWQLRRITVADNILVGEGIRIIGRPSQRRIYKLAGRYHYQKQHDRKRTKLWNVVGKMRGFTCSRRQLY